jgi:hypothetical protein
LNVPLTAVLFVLAILFTVTDWAPKLFHIISPGTEVRSASTGDKPG